MAEPGVEVSAKHDAEAGHAKRSSLRFKFLFINLTIVLALATVLFGLWEFTFYRSANEELERKLDEVVSFQSEILAIPVWNLETDRIQLILEAILRDDDFVMAVVTDESGNTLVQSSGDSASDLLINSSIDGTSVSGPQAIRRLTLIAERLHITTSSIVYDSDGGRQIIGELTLIADRKRILGQARMRIVLDLIMMVLLMTAAVIAALTAFRRTIDLPLSKLLLAINRTTRDGSREAVHWHSNDEMGTVIREYNDMQARQAGYEAELKQARDLLEERVRERTAELSDARDQADAANRTKSDFLAVMSHELRTPLNGVLGLADIVLDSPLSAEQKRSVGLIKDSGMTLLELLNDILDLSKIEAGRIDLKCIDFDLDRLLTRIREFWAPIAEAKGLAFRLDTPSGPLGVIVADPSRVRQIVFNLLNNALKFTEDGCVTLRVQCVTPADDDAQPDCPSREIRFEVIDQGIGIPSEVQDQVFSKFTQADSSTTRRFGGTGLGLAICKELAVLMGGAIGVSSEPGQGSTFWFTVRCEVGDPSRATDSYWDEHRAPLSPQPLAGRLKILAAEDNSVNQVLLSALVDKMGHDLEIVGNGADAVAAIRETRYDLVLMDVQMPKMDGETATKAIRALPGAAGQVPIIAVTANAMRGDRERYLACGMNDYVTKPIRMQDLLAAVHGCVGRGESASHEPADPAEATLEGELAQDPAATKALQSLVEDLDSLGIG